jgi:prepilin-type N-terminal cleavage/methylation domain-containing protein
MNTNTKRKTKGFTLLEILLVIAAIGILAAIVLVAINPNRQIAQARNTVRQADINTIQKAVEQYLIEKGSYPSSITTTPGYICNTGTEQVNGSTNCSGRVDLRELVPDYIAGIPKDPQATGPSTGYIVAINPDNNKVSISAVQSEGRAIVSNIFTVKDGLVLHLDAGNPASYPGSGTTWFDLSGNNNNGVLLNGVGFDSANGGSLVFDGINDVVDTINVSSILNMTIEIWMYDNRISGQRDVLSYNGDSGSYTFNGSTFRTDGNNIPARNFSGVGNPPANQWYKFSYIKNNNLYINQTQYNGSGLDTTYGLLSFGNTRSGINSRLNGRISIIRIYNRSLTPEEIAQNFNATRDRFGL